MQNNLSRAGQVDTEGVVWGAVSGLLTTVAAGGDVAALVNLDATPFIVTGIRLRFATTTAFSSAQCIGFRVNKVYGFTKLHDTGGTSVQAHYQYQSGVKTTRGGASVATGDRIPLTELAGYIGSTGAITGSTYTGEDTDEPEVFAVAAGSTLPGLIEDWRPRIPPLVLPLNTGIVVNNHITMGSSGVGNLFVGIDGYRLG